MTIATSSAVSGPRPSVPKPTTQDRRPGATDMWITVATIAAVLYFAWTRRNEGDITAETGIGYYLGIIGGLMMLVVLIYPLRKRMRALQFLGNIPAWFRVHMLIGVVGPALVVLHSNFTFGSLNSTAAMTAMLVVAGSGFIGRFLYSGIHRGLYGQKQTAADRLAEVEEIRTRLFPEEANGSSRTRAEMINELNRYQVRRLGRTTSLGSSLLCTLSGPISRYKLRSKLIKDFRQETSRVAPATLRQEEKNFLDALNRFFHSMGRAEAFTFYERSFAAWHLLHLPLFAILILATIAHVIAVHLY
jgi:hypothetical protein